VGRTAAAARHASRAGVLDPCTPAAAPPQIHEMEEVVRQSQRYSTTLQSYNTRCAPARAGRPRRRGAARRCLPRAWPPRRCRCLVRRRALCLRPLCAHTPPGLLFSPPSPQGPPFLVPPFKDPPSWSLSSRAHFLFPWLKGPPSRSLSPPSSPTPTPPHPACRPQPPERPQRRKGAARGGDARARGAAEPGG
jgi:hypothetical protein